MPAHLRSSKRRWRERRLGVWENLSFVSSRRRASSGILRLGCAAFNPSWSGFFCKIPSPARRGFSKVFDGGAWTKKSAAFNFFSRGAKISKFCYLRTGTWGDTSIHHPPSYPLTSYLLTSYLPSCSEQNPNTAKNHPLRLSEQKPSRLLYGERCSSHIGRWLQEGSIHPRGAGVVQRRQLTPE